MPDLAARVAREAEALQRQWRMQGLRDAGVPVRDIATHFGLTPMRVYQLTRPAR